MGGIDFNEGFSPVSRRRWRADIAASPAGDAFEDEIALPEGLALRPLYLPDDLPARRDLAGFPGAGSRIRGSRASGAGPEGWDIRIAVAGPTPEDANRILLADLESGATSLLLRFPETPDGTGPHLADLDDLDRLLADIHLALVPIALEAGETAPAAALLSALWQRRGTDPGEARGAFNIDPLGQLARRGVLDDGLDAALARLTATAAWTARRHPAVTSTAVDSTPYHDAGASETEELAFAMASGVYYLKILSGAGLGLDAAASQIAFSMSVGTDQFLGIAKLRAARRLWARITEACGVSEASRAMRLHARTARRELCRRNPWVNLPRATLAAFAAVAGGAESITVLPADDALDGICKTARRVARNLQVILKEEAHLDQVIDPAGGSWYVESLTDAVARTAWSLFQDIEGRGGILPLLTGGGLAERLAAGWQRRRKKIARRLDLVTAISDYPPLADEVSAPGPVSAPLPAIHASPAAPFRRGAAAKRPIPPIVSFDQAVAAAAGGAGLDALAAAWRGRAPALTAPALPLRRAAEDFERLQDAADAMLARTGRRPTVYLDRPLTAATGAFLRDFLAAGGIAAHDGRGRGLPDGGARIAILADRPGGKPADLRRRAARLQAAGVAHLFLAGSDASAAIPGMALAGVIHPGCDAIDLLRRIHHLAGVSP